jgi:uncharacterized membrane protein YfcA
VFATAGLIGSVVGARLAMQIDGDFLIRAFGVAMIAIALSMLIPRKNEGDPAVRLTPTMVWKLAPVGLVAGLAAGFFGIGGGFLIAPGLMAATGMTLANASASSLVSVTLFGGATSATYALHGQLLWPLFGALVVGGAFGTLAAMPLLRRIEKNAKLLRYGFALLVIAVGLFIILR